MVAKKTALPKVKPAKATKAGYPKSLNDFVWDRGLVAQELNEFESFLSKNPEFGENSHALPFFKSHQNLCGFLGLCAGSLAHPDKIAFELSLGGNYRPDFVIGCTQTQSVLFVELEDGKKNSFFSNPGSSKAKLASRLLGAISQVVDWSFQMTQLNDLGYKALLGFVPKNRSFLVISGRKASSLNAVETLRYKWVTDAVTVGNCPVLIQTYDEAGNLLRLHKASYGF